MYMKLLSNHWKHLAVVGAIVVSFIAGYRSNKPEEIILIEERIVEREVIVESSGERSSDQTDRIRVITQKPDGTKEEVEIDQSRKESEKIEERTVERDREKTRREEIISLKSNWRAGIWAEGVSSDMDVDYRVEAGWRAFGNFWLGAGYSTKNDISVGISYEW